MFPPWDYSESNISQFILEVMGKSQRNIENQNCSPSSCLSPKLLYYLFTRCHVSGKRTALRETYINVIRLNILPKATLFVREIANFQIHLTTFLSNLRNITGSLSAHLICSRISLSLTISYSLLHLCHGIVKLFCFQFFVQSLSYDCSILEFKTSNLSLEPS